MKYCIVILLIFLDRFALGQGNFLLISSDTILVEKHVYRIELKSDSDDIKILYIYRNDSIISSKKDYSPADMKIDDFNNDGYKDILFIHYPTNVPGISNLFLFYYKELTFKEVEDFRNFPDFKILCKGYYYSYHRSGCADYNWDSDLFYIKDFKAIKIANIHVIECSDAPKKGIYIYNLTSATPNLTDFIKLGKIKGDKWKFIQNYWKKNHKNFFDRGL
jgi:hypothetical protein